MKRHWVGFLVMCLPLAGIAGGWASSYSLGGGTVAVTNAQANSSWAPVAVFVRFDAAATGTATVKRESGGVSYTLGTCSFASATNLVWVAEGEYSFGAGDVFVVESTATNGVVQVTRRGE